jgi:hypothetical protein
MDKKTSMSNNPYAQYQGFRFDERRELLSLMLNSDNPTVQDAIENAIMTGYLALGTEFLRYVNIDTK